MHHRAEAWDEGRRRQQLEAIQPCEVEVTQPALCEAMAKESAAMAYAFHVEPKWFEQTPALTASERAATRRSLGRCRVSSEPLIPEAHVSTAEEYFKMLMELSSIDSEDTGTESEC